MIKRYKYTSSIGESFGVRTNKSPLKKEYKICGYVVNGTYFSKLKLSTTMSTSLVKCERYDMEAKKGALNFPSCLNKKETTLANVIDFSNSRLKLRDDLDIPNIKIGTRLAIRNNLKQFLENSENSDFVE